MRVARPAFVFFLLTAFATLLAAFATPLQARQSAPPDLDVPWGPPASLSERPTRLLQVTARGEEESSNDGPPIWLGGGVGVGTYGLSALADLSLRGEGPSVFLAR